MQTELYSLSKVFTENLFRIPDYQRGYSWGMRQLQDFWVDLVQLDEGRDHYTGVLTLEEVSVDQCKQWPDDEWIITSKRYRPYYVVDGQQRLTTSLILLQCILEVASDTELNYTSPNDIRRKFIYESRDKGISRSYIFGYEKDNPSYEFLKARIFLERSDTHSIGEETIYTQNLSAAKEFFLERLNGVHTQDLEKLFTKLTQHFLFNIYVIAGAIDVFVAFETMNNRGKLLSHLELLKNRLIFLSTRLDVDLTERYALRKVVNESWKTAYHFLGRNQKHPLDDDHFLSVQFLLYASKNCLEGEDPEKPRALWHRRRNPEEYKTYLLDKYFTISRVRVPDQGLPAITSQTISDYAHDLKASVEIYYRLLNPADSGFSDDIRIALERLRRLAWRDGLPLAVAALAAARPDEELLLLFRRIERYLFIRQIRMYYPDEEFDIITLATALSSGEMTVETASKRLHEITELIAKKFDLSEATAIWARGRAYYGWRGLKYFLFEYEQNLKERSHSNRDKLIWDEFIREDYENDYSTIEHVYPQKAKDPYWTERFGNWSTRQRTALRNSLGNLLAISRPKNASLSNRSFPEKKAGASEGAGYFTGSYSEIEVAQESEWTPEVIAERGIRMLEFFERRWSLNLGDRKKKLTALGLAFLEDGSDEAAEGNG